MSSQASYHCRHLGLNPSGSSGTLGRTRTSELPHLWDEGGGVSIRSHQSLVWLQGVGVNLLSLVACPLLMLQQPGGSPQKESRGCWQVTLWKWVVPRGCRWSSDSGYHINHLWSSISSNILIIIEMHI